MPDHKKVRKKTTLWAGAGEGGGGREGPVEAASWSFDLDTDPARKPDPFYLIFITPQTVGFES